MKEKLHKYELDLEKLAQVGATKHNLTHEQLFPPADPQTIDQAEKEKKRLAKPVKPRMMGLND